MTRLQIAFAAFLIICLSLLVGDRLGWFGQQLPSAAAVQEISDGVAARIQPGLTVRDLDDTLTRHNAPISKAVNDLTISVANLTTRVDGIESALQHPSPTALVVVVSSGSTPTATATLMATSTVTTSVTPTATANVTATAQANDLATRTAMIATGEAMIAAANTATPTPTFTPTPTLTPTPTNTPMHVVIDNMPSGQQVDPNSVATLVADAVQQSVSATLTAMPTQAAPVVVPPTVTPTATTAAVVPDGSGASD